MGTTSPWARQRRRRISASRWGEVGGFSFREVFKRLGCGREAVISKGVFVLLRFQSFSHIGFSHQCLDANDEFLDGEWFFEIVVGS